MHPLLETMLGKFDLSQEVVLAIENNNKKSYLKRTYRIYSREISVSINEDINCTYFP